MRILEISAKCSDMFAASLGDESVHGYVPRDIGIGGGDYVRMQIDADTGQILNWKPVTTILSSEEE